MSLDEVQTWGSGVDLSQLGKAWPQGQLWHRQRIDGLCGLPVGPKCTACVRRKPGVNVAA